MALAGLKKQIIKANQYISEKICSVEGTKFTGDYHEMEKKTDATIELVDDMINKTKEYLECDNDLYIWNVDPNKTSRHSNLMRNLQMEGKQLYTLKMENDQLRNALEEHQVALQYVMNKYRYLKECTNQAKVKYPLPDHLILDDKEIAFNRQLEKITEMTAIMAKATEIDENFGSKDQELIDKLLKENVILRKLLITQQEESKQEPDEETKDSEIQCSGLTDDTSSATGTMENNQKKANNQS